MNMKIFLKTVVIAGLLGGFLSGCATSVEPADAYKGESQHEIYVKGKAALNDKSFAEAIKRFEALDVQYPYGVETENAQLYLIYAYYKKEEYPMASAAADRFIRIHPTNANVDYAYYMRGLADYNQNLGVIERFFGVDLATRDLTQVQKSFFDFSELVRLFPQSRYAPSAHQYMVFLRNLMANHELEVAEYYYSRQAYLAAANRASDLVAHYQGAPAVIEGLKLMVKSYQKLGLTQQAQEAEAVLRFNGVAV